MQRAISQITRLFLTVIAICAAEICRGKSGLFRLVDGLLRLRLLLKLWRCGHVDTAPPQHGLRVLPMQAGIGDEHRLHDLGLHLGLREA